MMVGEKSGWVGAGGLEVGISMYMIGLVICE